MYVVCLNVQITVNWKAAELLSRRWGSCLRWWRLCWDRGDEDGDGATSCRDGMV